MSTAATSKKRAFVTGGTGFLGRHLVEQLVAAGWDVTCFHRASSNVEDLRALGVALAAGVLHEPDSVAGALPEAVDAVFHVAANTNTWARNNAAQTRDNVEGTRAVLEAALRKRARRFVHTSTWGTWGHGNPVVDEESPQAVNGDSWINYERTKWLAEQEVLAAVRRGLQAVILNPPHIMGRYDTTSWARLIRLAHQGRLPGIPPGSGMFAHAGEIARSHLAAAERGRVGERYLLPGAEGTFEDVVRLICELAGRELDVRVVPAFALKTLARLKVMLAAITGREPDVTPESASFVCAKCTTRSTRARDELGHRVLPLREIVEESYRWLESQGLLATRL